MVYTFEHAAARGVAGTRRCRLAKCMDGFNALDEKKLSRQVFVFLSCYFFQQADILLKISQANLLVFFVIIVTIPLC